MLIKIENRTWFGWLAEPGVLAAGVSSNPGFDSCLSPGFIPKKSTASIAWNHKEIATHPSPTEPWMVPVISRRTRSSYLRVVVDLVVYAWCV